MRSIKFGTISKLLYKMIKGLVFDLDGTLFDTVSDIANSVNYALKVKGYPTRKLEEFPSFLGHGSRRLIRLASPEGCSDSELDDTFNIYLENYLNNPVVDTKPYPGIKESLKLAKDKGLKLMCMTNKPEVVAKIIVEKYFLNTFDLIEGNRKDFKVKPDASQLLYGLNKLGLKPNEVAYFGDSDVDMLTCMNAKIENKVACLYGYCPKSEVLKYQPKYVLNTSKEMLSLIDVL